MSETVTMTAAAKIARCDRTTVVRACQPGQPLSHAIVERGVGNRPSQLLRAAVEVWAAMRAEARPLDPGQERARKDRADAELKELKLARERKELRPESEMVAEVVEHVKACRRKLLTLPRSIARSSPRSVRTAVRKSVDDGVHDALVELSRWNGNGASEASPSGECGAPTRSGDPCRRPAADGGRCYQHKSK